MIPAAKPIVATTTRSWPALANGSITPAGTWLIRCDGTPPVSAASWQMITDQFLLLVRRVDGLGLGRLRAMSAANASVARQRGEEQHGPKPLGQRLGREPWPVPPNVRRHIVVEHAGVNFLKRHRPFIVPNPLGITAKSLKGDHVLGIGHAAAEHEQLGLGQRHRDRQLVVQATVGIAEHLVFVDDQQLGAVAIDQSVF